MVLEILEAKWNSYIVLRCATIQLIVLLESDDLDHAFEYEHMIQQNGLNMLQLIPEVNLGVRHRKASTTRFKSILIFNTLSQSSRSFAASGLDMGL